MDSIGKKLQGILQRLKPNISIHIRSAPSWDSFHWQVSLETENNDYPYFLRWRGMFVAHLLDQVINYLDGKIPQPHGCRIIPPSDWQREKEQT